MWLGKIALTLALAAVAVAVVGTTLARFDVIDKMTGFMSFVVLLRPLFSIGEFPVGPAMLIAAFSAVVLLLGWILARKTNWSALVGLLVAGALLAAGGWLRGEAEQYTAIHDITTNLDDPPTFNALKIPEDNLRGVETEEKWRELHAEGYGDLAPMEISASAADAIDRAEELAEARGWTVIAADPAAGRMEAVAYAGWIKFEDIVVLTATPDETGGSTLNMRSISRVGGSDLGYNGKRIREFLGAMAGAEEPAN